MLLQIFVLQNHIEKFVNIEEQQSFRPIALGKLCSLLKPGFHEEQSFPPLLLMGKQVLLRGRCVRAQQNNSAHVYNVYIACI